jgi:hypothetical protein
MKVLPFLTRNALDPSSRNHVPMGLVATALLSFSANIILQCLRVRRTARSVASYTGPYLTMSAEVLLIKLFFSAIFAEIGESDGVLI